MSKRVIINKQHFFGRYSNLEEDEQVCLNARRKYMEGNLL